MEENVFEEMAKRYDNAERQRVADIIAEKVLSVLTDATHKTLIDYGSGTGLVSLQLAPHVASVVLVDASQQMLDIAAEKIKRQQIENATVYYADFTKEMPNIQADIVFLSLVLLHIPDTALILKNLATMLPTGGQLYVVDFDENARVSHPKVHSGFNHAQLSKQLQTAGFEQVHINNFYAGEKMFMNEDAVLFLAQAVKKCRWC